MHNSRVNKPHFHRTIPNKEKENGNKLKLIALLLKNAIHRHMKVWFKELHQYSQRHYATILKAMARINTNLEITRLMAFKKLKAYSQIKAKENLILKSALIIGSRFKEKRLHESFWAILSCTSNKYRKQAKKFNQCRLIIFLRTLKRFEKNQIKFSFKKIRRESEGKGNKIKKVKIIELIFQEIKLRNKMKAWAQLTKESSKKRDIKHELNEIANLKKQLSNKSKECKSIENQLRQVKMHSRSNSLNSQDSNTSLKSKRGVVRKKSNSLEREKEDRKSETGSILSWLSGCGSYMTFRSGKSSRQVSGVECFCKYRDKYNHYKCETVSLKNQLDIIKNELEVARDLNDHLQEQICNLCVAEQNYDEMKSLKQQIKQLRKERQQMLLKMGSYQKYITNLKFEFKTKIENLYRNLKRGN